VIYEFQEVGGSERIELVYSVSDRPAVGSIIKHKGKKYRRIISGVQVDAGVESKVHGYPYTSFSLPKNINDVPGIKHDNHGRPVIQSRSQERELCARYGLVRD
jgi:hypothetical protein